MMGGTVTAPGNVGPLSEDAASGAQLLKTGYASIASRKHLEFFRGIVVVLNCCSTLYTLTDVQTRFLPCYKRRGSSREQGDILQPVCKRAVLFQLAENIATNQCVIPNRGLSDPLTVPTNPWGP